MLNSQKSIELYQAIADGNEQRTYDMWHASSIAMCPRAQYLKRLGIPEVAPKPSGALVIRWQAGHNLEAAIQPYIGKVYGGIVSNERITSTEMQLTGEFDNLVLTDNRLVEIKSVHDYAFFDRDGVVSLKENIGTWPNGKNKWGSKDTPYLGHELQNHGYVLLLAGENKSVTDIDYVYISLSGRLVVYSTKVQDKLLFNVTARLKALNEAWEAQEAPVCICVPEHELYDSVMKFCPYKTEHGCCEYSNNVNEG